MVFLAHINEENICTGLKMLKDKIEDGKHVEIESMDEDYIYRKYENGAWSEEKFLPEVVPQEPEPTMKELKENQVAMMNGIIDLYMSNLGG